MKKNMKKNNLEEYKKYYTNSSEAHELDTQPVIKEPEKKKRPKTSKKIKVTTKYVYKEIVDKNFSAFTYLLISVVFLGCFINLSLSSQIKLKQDQIRLMSTKLNDIEISNEKLKLDSSNTYSLSEIETIAISRLGMSKPQPHQIIHIDIEKSSYPSHSEATYIDGDD